MGVVRYELLALITQQPMNVMKLAQAPALNALVLRESRALDVRIEQDRFWAKFA